MRCPVERTTVCTHSDIFRTVAGASLQSSLWPYLLRSDVAGNGSSVRLLVRVAATAMPLATLLIAVAGVVTPLGLGQEIVELEPTMGTFEYIRDVGPYEYGTALRGMHNFTRMCEQGPGMSAGPAVCPWSDNIIIFTQNETTMTWDMPGGYDMAVPDDLRAIFSSGTSGGSSRTTVANFFDIEWRQLTTRRSENVNNNVTYATGLYRQLGSFVLEGSYKLLEGLVVDARNGGIGFRNHTVPTGLEQGATWKEDLLFIEPVTECVDTNLTVDFGVTTDLSATSDDIVGGLTAGGYVGVRLTDRGGFHRINQSFPYYDRSDPQANPDLTARAYKAAYLHNVWTMRFLNVTSRGYADESLTALNYLNSSEGREFRFGNESVRHDFRHMDISPNFSGHLPVPDNATLGLNLTTNRPSKRFPNPWKITDAEFEGINIICNGVGDGDAANISTIYVGCSLMRGTPRRTNPGPPATFDDGSEWTAPLHVCASAIQTIVKTVEFSVNTTGPRAGSLDGITVRSIRPKVYASLDDTPLWGMENGSNLTIGGYAPVWGIVAPEYMAHPNVSTTRSPRLLLPGLAGDSIHATTLNDGMPMLYNLPGANFAFATMNRVFQLSGQTSTWPFDLLGGSSMALFKRWQAMASDPSEVSKIIDLMWTDLATSAVVGTKSTLGELGGDAAPIPGRAVPVTIRTYGRRITYNYLFGIPAYILAAFIILTTVIAMLVTCFGGAGLRRIKLRLGQVSAGRIFTTFLHHGSSSLTMPSEEWRRVNGDRKIFLGTLAQRADESAVFQLPSGQGQGQQDIHEAQMLMQGQKR